MKPLPLAGWRPILTAFTLWFAHFMLSWATAELWPGPPMAHPLAWVFTVLALAGLVLHLRRIRSSPPRGELGAWTRRFALGAVAIATTAVLFVALPSLILLR